MARSDMSDLEWNFLNRHSPSVMLADVKAAEFCLLGKHFPF